MAEVTIQAVKRESTGKGAARKVRALKRVPGVLYGQGMDPVSVEVDRRDLINAFHTDAGMNVLFNIELDGEKTTALAKDLQRDPIKGTLMHADFIKIDLKQEVEVEVPVHVVGEPAGVKEGGVLEQPLFNVLLRCLPAEVPESIDADVSALGIGDSIKVADLPSDTSYEILTDSDSIVASVAAPISEAELEAMEAGVAPEEEEAEPAEAGEAAEDAEAGQDESRPQGDESAPGS
ncbi:MAG: 50S ribosomal protein L25/general stress protein Ctc [Actinomycetota bacterium]|nr:50S ribosomal protein L25/general stress protein Ctc [Actinomycetota bacterium]